MNPSFRSYVPPVLAACTAVLLSSSAAQAQDRLIPVSPAMNPNPVVFAGTAGGGVEAQVLGGNCRGSVANLSAPMHSLLVQSPMPYLRIVGRAQGDTTLIVRTPSGLVCDDDGGGNFNPAVDLQNVMPGRYDIWVGSYRAQELAPYHLAVTTIPGIRSENLQPTGPAFPRPPEQVQPPNPNGNTVFQPLPNGNRPPPAAAAGFRSEHGSFHTNPALAPEFSPNARPRFGLLNVAGPNRGASGRGMTQGSLRSGFSCAGFYTAEPSFVMNLRQPMPFVRLDVGSAADTTLMVQEPDGSVHCVDDRRGEPSLAPLLEGENLPSGRYLIWVGIYRENSRNPYQLNVVVSR